MKRPFLDHVEALSAIAAALDAALYIATDPTAADLVTELIAWSQGTAEETADSLMREQPSPTNSHRLAELLAQLADTLEQTDLCPVERAQFAALLAALRVEASTCQEVAA